MAAGVAQPKIEGERVRRSVKRLAARSTDRCPVADGIAVSGR
ncbi:hypothetical protein ABZ876_12500 [Streptomyces sp. NPDC046931]